MLNEIETISGSTFKITYDPAKVTLVSFAAQTNGVYVNVGAVPGTDLTIVSHNTTTGELTFTSSKAVVSGKTWTGAITMLKFKAKVTGDTTIHFVTIP